MKKFMMIVMIALVSFAIFAGGSSESNEDVYKIALVAPLTGPGTQYGQAYKTTIEILLDRINNKEGGVNGKKVVVDYYDDKQEPKETLNIANKIVADGHYVAVIGSQTSSCSMSAAPVFEKAGIPMISPQASHADFAKMGEYIFSLQMPAAYQIRRQATWAIENFNAKRIALIYKNDDWGAQCISVITQLCKDLGVELVAAETFMSGQTKDFSPLITAVKDSNPDVVYIGAEYPDACLLFPQMEQLEFKSNFVSTNMLHRNEFLDVVGDAAEGLLIFDPITTLHAGKDYDFINEEYGKRTNGGLVDAYVSSSFDALSIIVEALRNVGSDHAAIRDYIAGISNYDGVSGVFSFDDDGFVMKAIYQYKVENGKYVENPDVVLLPEN